MGNRMRVHHQKSLGQPVSRQTQVAAESSEAVVSHRSSPWGGHLIKMEVPTLGCGAFRQPFWSPAGALLRICVGCWSCSDGFSNNRGESPGWFSRSRLLGILRTARKVCGLLINNGAKLLLVRSLFIEDAPADSKNLFVRPEAGPCLQCVLHCFTFPDFYQQPHIWFQCFSNFTSPCTETSKL